MMIKPEPIYRVMTGKLKTECELFPTFEDAFIFMRQFMEADGNKVFCGETKPGSRVYKWMDWSDELPKFVSKTIGIANQKDIDAYWKEQAEIERAKRTAEWLERIRTIVKENERARIEKESRTGLAITWID